MQDSIDVFPTPVDSVRVAAQDVTSQQITKLLDLTDSLQALWNMIDPLYIFFVCVTYYIVVTRVSIIKTNSKDKRNALIAALIIIIGIVFHFWRGLTLLDSFVTGLSTMAFYEFIFKKIFSVFERVGLAPLPEWHVEELKVEKQNDIAQAQLLQQKPKPKP